METYEQSVFPEPWLKPGCREDFAFSKEEREIGITELEAARDCPSSVISVYDIKGKVIRTEVMCGAMAFIASHLKCVEVEIDQQSTLSAWKMEINKAAVKIRKWMPAEYRLGPCNPGRHSLVKRNGEMKARLFMVFANDGIFDPIKPDPQCGRYGPLSQHLQLGTSKLVMSGATVQLAPDSPHNYYRDWDSFCFIKKSSLDVKLDSNIVKLYFNEDITKLARKMGEGSPTPVGKVVGLVIPDEYWYDVQYFAGVSFSVDSDIICCNKKDIKFTDGRNVIHCLDVWKVLNTVNGKKATVTREWRQLDSVRPEAMKVLSQTRKEAAEQIHHAYSSYADGNAQPLINMTSKVINEMANISEEDALILTDEEIEDRDILFNSIKSVNTMLVCGLPCPPSKVLELIRPLIRNSVLRIRVPGSTKFAMPSNLVGKYGIALSGSDRRRLGLSTKDLVSIARHPNGWGEAKVTRTHCLDAIAVDPNVFADRFGGDFDGDLISMVGYSIFDNSRLGSNVPKNADATSALPNLVYIFAASSFGKLSVGMGNYCADTVISADRSDLLPSIEIALQGMVDMAKKVIPPFDLPMDIVTMNGILKYIPTLMVAKGNVGKEIGALSKTDTMPVIYPNRLDDARKEMTPMSPLFAEAMDALPMVLCEQNSAYSTLKWNAKSEKNTKRKKYLDGIIEEYETFLRYMGQNDLVWSYGTRQSFYEIRSFPEKLSVEKGPMCAREINAIINRSPMAVKVAHQIHTLYLAHITALRNGTDNAYQHLADIRERILKADTAMVSDAMRVLFYALVMVNSTRGKAFLDKLATKVHEKPITTKSVAILASLPVVVGDYNLKDMVDYIGYVREPGMRVI